jgi:hypothetical protein
MNELKTISIFIAGIVTGVVVCRYGMGLWAKAVYQAKEDEPLGAEPSLPIEQSITGEDFPISQDQTEIL